MRSTGRRTSPGEAPAPRRPEATARRGGGRKKEEPSEGLEILVVNWQDRRNPQAGGAEVHLHEIFSRLASRGHRVRLLVSGWPGAPPEEEVDGMEVVRAGGRFSFPLAVRSAYRRHFDPRELDVVVEDINKIPLFTPWWVGAPVVGLVPHLFGTTAFRQEPVHVAAAVWIAERGIPFAYREVPFQAISESTAEDLAARGVARDRIEVIPPGIDHERYGPDPASRRYESPTVVYVGRLKRYKGLEVVIAAIRRVRDRGVPVRLLVAGRGDDRARLERIAARQEVEDGVAFLGWVSEEKKVELLRRAWANVYPSPKEGWGITNVEAAACGTPSVASDSPGLRESVADGEGGLLVPHDSPDAWAAALERLCRDPDLRRRLGEGALRHAARFSWDRAADETETSLGRHAAAATGEPARARGVSGEAGPDAGTRT